MANISVANSDYTSGGIDTRATLDGTSLATFQQMNGAASGVVAIETILGDGPTLKGNKADLASRLAEVTDANGAIIGHTLGAHTNTVATGAIIFAETSGTPAAGIGTGILLRSESQDETPSDLVQYGGSFTDVGTGAEDSQAEIKTRINGAALATTYVFAANGSANFAKFTQSNNADRTYTLQNQSYTLIGRDTTDTLTNKSIDSNANTLTIRAGALTTATGSASGAGIAIIDITMNDYAFFPATFDSASAGNPLLNFQGTDPSNTIGRFSINVVGGTTAGARWRYLTATDMPELHIAIDNITGLIRGTWTADDPPGGGGLGIHVAGCTTVRLTAADLEHMSILTEKASEAADLIRDRKQRIEHQAYRALQLVAHDDAPSLWVLQNCQFTAGKLEAKRG